MVDIHPITFLGLQSQHPLIAALFVITMAGQVQDMRLHINSLLEVFKGAQDLLKLYLSIRVHDGSLDSISLGHKVDLFEAPSQAKLGRSMYESNINTALIVSHMSIQFRLYILKSFLPLL